MAYDIGQIDDGAEHRFSAGVPREFVHRRAISEVFVTGIQRNDQASYTLSAQWPRWHVFFGSPSGGYDSALIVETLRQLTILIAHTQLQVPLGMQFLMPDISVTMKSGAIRDPLVPTEVTAEVQVVDIRSTGRGVTAFRTNAIFRVDGQKVADGTAGARIVDPHAYIRLRSGAPAVDGHRLASPVPAVDVGHSAPWNVVLGESAEPGCWPLRVDASNPILFDHPLDHVPGVLLIEAVRQATRLALLSPSMDFSSLKAQFLSVTEFGDEAVVGLESVTAGPESATLLASVRANGKVRMYATATIRVTERAPTGPTRSLQPKQAATGHADRHKYLDA